MSGRTEDIGICRSQTRRTVLAGLASAGLTIACDEARENGKAMAPAPVPLSHYGVDRFAIRDQTAGLRGAFEAAAHDGHSLTGDPDAVYRHDGRLLLQGVSFDGQGCTLMPLSDGPQVLQCRGAGWRLANLRVLGAATRRSSDNGLNGVWIGGDEPEAAADFIVDNIRIDGVGPTHGIGTAGIMFSHARNGRLSRATVRASHADGIHITAGSHHLLVEQALVEDSGDDSFAVVSYREQGAICHDIRIRDGVSRRSAARGMAVVGGEDITFERVSVQQSSAAGVYLYSESSFDTYGVARVQVIDAALTGCVTGVGLPDGFSNAAIIVGGREGADPIRGETLLRGATDCRIVRGAVAGAGAACTAAISTHAFAIRPRIDGTTIHGEPSPSRGHNPAGIEIGGRDVAISNVAMTGVAGLAMIVLPTAAGDCQVERVTVAGSSLVPGPIASYVYTQAAPALRHLSISDCSFAGGPGQVTSGALAPGRLVMSRNHFR